MIQSVLALLQEPRAEARDNALARELRYAALSMRKGFDEVLAKAVEFRVSACKRWLIYVLYLIRVALNSVMKGG